MSLRDFISKQFIDVIDWTEPEDGILAYRFPIAADVVRIRRDTAGSLRGTGCPAVIGLQGAL